ncbi:MAG TPA: tetratricopeptide repeat protein [Rhizomicrobium sp.]|nr:tetratricopeptide repeat protein [Rhizomicrobium sp.]
MNRLLACTSIIALCAGFVASAAMADDQPAAADAPSAAVTIATEIGHAHDQRVKGDLAGAAKTLQQLLLVANTDPRVLGEYGKVLVQQGHAKDAIKFLARATQLGSNDWTVYSALGVAYDQNDDHTDARKSYDRALAMKPGEASILNNYAVSRMLTGDYDGAVQTLSQIEKSGASDPKIAANLAKAEELKAAHPSANAPVATAQSQPAKPAPVAVATLAAPKPQDGVVMQKVPADPLAGPVRNANAAPRQLNNAKPVRPTLAAEAAKLKVPASAIVMQKVPADPKAGPVKDAKQEPKAKTTVEAKTAPKAPEGPSLRTASD